MPDRPPIDGAAALNPGQILLQPLGWIAERLERTALAEPNLLSRLIRIDRPRMHLLGLALAHMRADVSTDAVSFLLQGSEQEVLDSIIDDRPVGFRRAFQHLPGKVIAAHNYRKLVDLLRDRTIAKFLHHRSSIEEATIADLHALPAPLRKPVFLQILDRVEGFSGITDALAILAMKAGISAATMFQQIGCLDQPEQIIARVRKVLDTLPLTEALPPIRIGNFRRIDRVNEIRSLAKSWRNCLAECLYGINDGTSAVYLSESDLVISLLTRLGRLGWFVAQAKGPKNTGVETPRLNQIQACFDEFGFFSMARIEPVRKVLLSQNWRRAEHGAENFDLDLL